MIVKINNFWGSLTSILAKRASLSVTWLIIWRDAETDVKASARNAIEHCFIPEADKAALRMVFDAIAT